MSTDTPAGAAPTPAVSSRGHRLDLLRNANFRRMWWVGGAAMAMQWLEMLAGSIFVFNATQSPFAVTLLMLARAAPMVALGMLIGAVAERLNRRNLLIAGYGTLVLVSAGLGTLAYTGHIAPWHVGVGMLLTGTVFSMEFPIRRNLLGEFAGMEQIGTAMGLDSVLRNGMRIVGPLAGGGLMEFVGLHGAYFLASATYACIVYLLVRVENRAPGKDSARGPSLFTTIVEGLRFARSDRAVIGLLSITIVMNLWGFPYMSLVPVIGQERLGLSELPIGLLVATEGLGSMLGALAIAFAGLPWPYRRMYFYGASLALAAIVGFSLSLWFGLSILIMFMSGLGLAGFSTMQGTLPFVLAPPEMRSRILGLLSVCIGTGPIGILHLGILAELVGASMAVTISGIEGLVALVVLFFWIKEAR